MDRTAPATGAPQAEPWDHGARWESRGLLPEARSVPTLRREARAVLRAWGVEDRAEEVLLILSELAANAVRHARTPFDAVVDWEPAAGRLRVAVADGDARLPRARPLTADSSGGRGLHLLGELADEWGVEARPAGKVVWFAVGVAPRPRVPAH